MPDAACCTDTSPDTAPACPLTGRATLPVSRFTVLQHVRDPGLADVAYGFCDVPDCSVVYVGDDGRLIDKMALRTRVGIKETDDPVPVCYCFGFTRRAIVDDTLAHGHSTIREYIADQVRDGRCACERTNPSGRCCLGTVARTIASAASNRPSGAP